MVKLSKSTLELLSFGDLFSQPVKWKTLRYGGVMSSHFGSKCGFLLSFVGISIWFSYFGYLWDLMMRNKLDSVTTQEVYHNYEDPDELLMRDFSFLPSIRMSPHHITKENNDKFMKLDIFDDE